ncbi:response regulator transcription factor [Cryobacterium sp. SO2]|uniref:response regulator n=1 Tax=Cryobacterium sp. SO2 TaxID=1897060 RepID=UPI00223DBC38|nr:response regulator transcription factor [Cryobacterium sp. SO2]WEO78729.1 response regulator transcription factor [Cryobacterium sp. SO2]
MITDDDPIMRDSYRQLIDMQDDMHIVAEAASGLEAFHTALEVKPDVLLMDLHMPGMDGVEATRRICARTSEIRILVVTIFDQPEDVEAAVVAGAAGFIVKNGPLTDLLRAIRVIHAGGGMLSPEVTSGIIERMRTGGHDAQVREIDTASGPLVRMTERESEMLQLIAQGKSNSEIASELYLAQSSVKTYVSRLRAKLGARTRSELVTLYYEGVRHAPEEKHEQRKFAIFGDRASWRSAR